MRESIPLVFVLLFLFVRSAHSLTQTGKTGDTIQIGQINYFGYAGLNLEQTQGHLPVHVGDSVSVNRFDQDRKLIQNSVQEVTGKPATDIAAVCCDEAHRLLIYIGLSGTSSHTIARAAAPHGNDHLEAGAIKLYEQETAAIEDAVRRGSAGEDDSRGYAISDDPAARKIELAMRVYASQRGPEIEKVLRNSADRRQREASALLLGYADRSDVQIQSLAEAANDADDGVRNDAVRALGVLANARNAPLLRIDPAPFIEMLFSGRWTDRNKGSLLLAQLSRQRNPVLLEELRGRALQPLVEGAKWDGPHSAFFLLILGRIANIPEARLGKMIGAGDTNQIIRAAELTNR